jgi:hypothetical protein
MAGARGGERASTIDPARASERQNRLGVGDRSFDPWLEPGDILGAHAILQRRAMKFGSAQDIWETVLGELQTQVSQANYETWLKDTVGQSYEAGLFVVGVANPFAREWLEKRLRSLIRKTLMRITRQDLDVEFVPLLHGRTLPAREAPADPSEKDQSQSPPPPPNWRGAFGSTPGIPLTALL